MNAFRVNQELLPKRCEICHQADLFDRKKNFCQRCAKIPAIKKAVPIVVHKSGSEISTAYAIIGFCSATIFSFLFGLFGLIMSVSSCHCHCSSSFHPFHLFTFLPMFSLGIFVGLQLVYRFSLSQIIETISNVLGRVAILSFTTSIVGAITGFLYQMRDAYVYYPAQERFILGGLYGVGLALILGFTIYPLVGLYRLFTEHRDD